MQIELLLLVGAALLLSLLQLCNSSGLCSESFKCGDDTYSYPFWGNNRPSYCGISGFELNCRDSFTTQIEIKNSNGFGQTYRVLNTSEANQIMTIVRSDVWNLVYGYDCPSAFLNDTTSYKTHFEYVSDTLNYTLFYGCPFNASYEFGGSYCIDQVNRNYNSLYVTADSVGPNQNTSECQGSILIPVRPSSVNRSTYGILWSGFDVMYVGSYHSDCVNCTNFGGGCGNDIYNDSSFDDFYCYPAEKTRNLRRIIALVIGPISGFILVIILACVCWRRKYSSVNSIVFWKKSKNYEKLEEFLRNYGSMAPKRYTYSDITRMTDSFKDKLGQGGFGGVFKGKLLDGRLVAVKVMRESKGDGADFMNEVASISRTSHVNVVSLLGFCFDGSKKALIYEFMSNGSLEKFIYKDKPLETSSSLPWEKLYEIVVGVSRGLEYLHRVATHALCTST
ncbi:hypothetical protein GIB67_020707 [Kingdonia uniflora]|uniref:Protein kinase domain-containing protein n=1 Tax=Kingdonia uniflora TaxID=39325 RepID=A0A7J7P103_9MAGN|nr:hypothetical protein GIB67_020707 [Kingdonia uniflora]